MKCSVIGCECVAQIALCKAHRQKMHSGPKHGLRSTYVNYGCRCPLCQQAASEYDKARRKKLNEYAGRYNAHVKAGDL